MSRSLALIAALLTTAPATATAKSPAAMVHGVALVTSGAPTVLATRRVVVIGATSSPPAATLSSSRAGWVGAPPATGSDTTGSISGVSLTANRRPNAGWRPLDWKERLRRTSMVAGLARSVGIDDPLVAYAVAAGLLLAVFTLGSRLFRRKRRRRR